MAIPEDETSQLRKYTLAKQEVATAIRAIAKFFQAQNRPDTAEQCQELLVKLAEDRFNLAVVGQFKRGKSSLMNAVIGRDLLPTGLLPLTSAITALSYGPQERVILRRRGWALEQEIPLSELANYVTEQGNPGNEKGLLEARVELPVRFLRRGLHFVDTPGVGSARHENSLTTYAFLPEADAVIFVTSVEAPLSETEESFLRDIRQYVRKLFVVVNKMDLLASGERNQVMGYIHAGVERALGADHVRLHPLSARQALAAKLNADHAGVRQSGLEELEVELASFLADEKSQVFLTATLDRALRILEEAGPNEPSDRSPSADGSSTGEGNPLDSLRRTVISLRAGLLSGEFSAAAPPGNEVGAANGKLLEQAEASRLSQRRLKNRPAPLRSATCPICEAQGQALFDFFVDTQYALSRAEAARRAFAQERGFCRVHTWQFQQIAAPQTISEGYASLIEAAATELRELAGQPAEGIAARIDTSLRSPCTACQVMHDTESAQIGQFLAQIATRAGQELYARSPGLCLPHLRMVLAASPPREVAEYLIQEQVRRLEDVSEDMRSYVLKRDALRRGLQNRDEEVAWRRALVQLAGEQNVCASSR
jgi:predicted GTPase